MADIKIESNQNNSQNKEFSKVILIIILVGLILLSYVIYQAITGEDSNKDLKGEVERDLADAEKKLQEATSLLEITQET